MSVRLVTTRLQHVELIYVSSMDYAMQVIDSKRDPVQMRVAYPESTSGLV